MQRETAYSIEGIGLVPLDFYRDAETVINALPEQWDAVHVGPALERDDNGHVVAYLGAQWFFVKRDKYVGIITDNPSYLLNEERRADTVKRVEHAFAAAVA